MTLLSRRYPRDHRHAVGGKANLLVRVKIGNGLDEADAPHLKQIVGILAPLVKALYDAENQPQISFNEFFPGVFVARLRPAEQGVHFHLRQNVKSRCVDAAYLYFSLHGSLLCGDNRERKGSVFHSRSSPVFPGSVKSFFGGFSQIFHS